ncbi:MAG TPA: hypothetical protein VL357_01720 [Rariglobus sp.]|jgi:hypothetical protein|nr:hypothetical protein [Rariglobus sp.]
MAKITQQPQIKLEITFTVNEAEARALDALVGYGSEGFLKMFYEHLGSHYMKPNEAGLISLFESIRRDVPPILSRTDDARKVFSA